MKTNQFTFYMCAITLITVWFLTRPAPVPHLDPPVIVVRNECGNKVSLETLRVLFAAAGDSIDIVNVSKCEKAFYMHRKPKPKRDASWSDLKRIGGSK